MKKFIVLYHMPAALASKMGEASPEEQAEGMKAWMEWSKNCGDKLIDMGSPLMGGIALSANGGSTPSNKDVSGYSILEAENMEAAKALLQGHPHLGWEESCSIEVHEAMPIPGM